jgi:RNA polymerase sigma factor (TIGR02999 family)
VASLEPRPVDASPDVTQLLVAWGAGDVTAIEQLAPVLQRELRRVASHHLAGERPGHILQTSALVNEAYLRLIDWKSVGWQNPAQFFGITSQMMRRILVDYARAQHREKRGGGAVHVSLSHMAGVPFESSGDIAELDEALRVLESFAPRRLKCLRCRWQP